ncbi:MAG TPA: FtsH protease activity modulator HflK [Rudaea sp.]|nr:FtsH protease activity modulator HflK [Rudaea sp.]
MAWNEPGGGKRDPWQGKKPPPDVEDMLRRLREGVGRLFGSGGSGSTGGGISIAVLALVLVWIGTTCWKVVDARQIGVVLRFGQFNRVMTSGLNLKWPTPIEQVIPVEATSVRSVSDEVRMLTKDENIVQIDFNVQYQVTDARQFLFSMYQPDETLKQAAESAVRQVVGRSEMDTILSGHGSEVVGETKKLLQQTLDGYSTGIVVTEINFQRIQPPSEVKKAFDDANSAGNNQTQFINDANAYAAQVVPIARGEAAGIRAAAAGYKAARIAQAEGDAQAFSLVEAQYKAAPEVTRKRLYLETMQAVLGASQKIIDESNGKSLLYLPLDKARPDNAAAAAAVAADSTRGGAQ